MTLLVLAAPNAATVASEAPPESTALSGTLDPVATLETPPSYDGTSPISKQPTPMIIDAKHNLGFTAGYFEPAVAGQDPPPTLAMYDLTTLELLDKVTGEGVPNGPEQFEQILNWAVDVDNTRLLSFTSFDAKATCTNGVDVERFYDYAEVEEGRWKFLLRTSGSQVFPHFPLRLPCPGNNLAFYTQAASIYTHPVTEERKLYVVGSYATDTTGRFIGTSAGFGWADTRNNTGSPFYLRQIDLTTQATTPSAALDWQIDLTKYGCGRFVTFFVARAGDSVYSYCHDHNGEHKNVPAGQQGYLVRIPLDGSHQPLVLGDGEPLVERPPPPPPGVDPRAWVLPHERLNAVVRRIPTLPGFTRPFLDPGTSRILLLTDDFVNGEAVWVLDPIAERFLGVMTPGDPPPRQRQVRAGETLPSPGAAGFNPTLGRAYLYGVEGIVVASGRQKPPMAGTLYPVLGKKTHPIQARNEFSRPAIAVAPRLRRLFVPVQNEGYVVLEDGTPDPLPEPEEDPDLNTVQVDEKEGVTAVNTFSEAEASGVHVVMAGGTANVVNPNDPLCATPVVGAWTSPNNTLGAFNIFLEENGERAMLRGSCLSERVVAGSHRDFALGYSTAVGATSTGVEAEGQGVAFAPSDRAASRDIQNAGDCYRGQIHATGPSVIKHWTQGAWDGRDAFDPVFGADDPTTRTDESGPWDRLCRGAQDGAVRCRRPDGSADQGCRQLQKAVTGNEEGAPDLTMGTRGRDGRGFPAPAARCSDVPPRNDRARTTGAGDLHVFESTARCKPAKVMSEATSRAVGMTLPGSEVPMSVRSSGSSVDTERTKDEGVVTTARAWAEGIQVGPLTIGSVAAEAVTKARGRTGTAQAELTREWCDVSVAGEVLVEECQDPESSEDIRLAVDNVNQALQKVRLTIPVAGREASDGGYQGIVKKDEGVIAADRTINDDDSETVPALQVTAYNDNIEGRSRIITQFAGVRTESRYGIELLPKYTTPTFPPYVAPEVTDGTPPTPPSVVRTEAIPPIPGRPPTFGVEYLEARFAGYEPGSGARSGDSGTPFGQLIQNPLQALLEWLRQSPREFALLFLVFSILALPIYLIMRRRTFERALVE